MVHQAAAGRTHHPAPDVDSCDRIAYDQISLINIARLVGVQGEWRVERDLERGRQLYRA